MPDTSAPENPPTPHYPDGTEATPCREYLGAALGYCDGAVQVVDDRDGRGFCTDHAKERGF